MYLEKLEIQGFKSFANKNKLIFSGLISDHKRGLTAIVGPNGSGKSNVADSIRWALGEQSLKTLRGKKSEDVIFSGSDQKNQLGMAEVSLHLNNADAIQNKSQAPETAATESDLDQIISNCPEITITRRIFRNGESEYLLNNNRVRLADTQMLLAKANFGQKTYSVIGQGMVENFLNTSAAERKDFFDEATGVKQFQIKRDSALNKLESSYENLQQVEMLLAEIKPRLKSLTRQVDKLNKRSQIETELKTGQLNYYHSLWQEIDDSLNTFNTNYLSQEKIKIDREKKLAKLSEELNKIKVTDNNQEIDELKPRLQELYNSKNQLHKQLVKIQAELEISLETQGQFDLSWLNGKQTELSLELEKINKELLALKKSQENEAEKDLNNQLNQLNKELELANNKLRTVSQGISGGERKEQTKAEVNQIITEFLERLEEISNQEDLSVIKNQLQEAKNSFRERIKGWLTTEDSKKLQEIKEIQENVIALNEKKQTLTAALNELHYQLAAKNERLKMSEEKKLQITDDLADIKNKIAKKTTPPEAAKITQEKNDLEQKVEILNKQIKDLEDELAKLNSAKDQEKSLIFDYQRNLQGLQTEINSLNVELNELKIKATRQETRLEDLEANIRNDELDLTIIKNHQATASEIDYDKLNKKINELKNQLEQIGGIDPETEKEYRETKERYDFLNTQTTDLNQAVKSLEEIIYELDVNIKNRFDSEFKVISEKFNDYFKILFNGGTAKISKIMIADLEKEEVKNNSAAPREGQTGMTTGSGLTPAETEIKNETDEKLKRLKFLKKYNAVGLAGIDIQATPPGKKIQVVSMLSGGERALTAIALICAIISANPSPFVVLDEVDAALDEANSERLATILDDLSNKTQFIVITHNRASMRKASILYGVTMESDGVSKLLSIKLDDYKK
ncbi:MAG: AAA family ATPase [Patescibacteria group bacterium]